jgi:hypothetical protein
VILDGRLGSQVHALLNHWAIETVALLGCCDIGGRRPRNEVEFLLGHGDLR